MSAHHPTRSLLIESALRLAGTASELSAAGNTNAAMTALRRSRQLFEQLVIELAPLGSDLQRASAESLRGIVHDLREIECNQNWDGLEGVLQQSVAILPARKDAA